MVVDESEDTKEDGKGTQDGKMLEWSDHMVTIVSEGLNSRVSVEKGGSGELVSSVDEDESSVQRVNTVFSRADCEELADPTEES